MPVVSAPKPTWVSENAPRRRWTGTNDDRQPWERQRGESHKAYAAYRAFRDRGPDRSLVGARAIERRWSSAWGWRERTDAWDAERYRRRDEALLNGLSPVFDERAPASDELDASDLAAVLDKLEAGLPDLPTLLDQLEAHSPFADVLHQLDESPP